MQNKAIDIIREWDPAKAEAYLKVNTNPWTNGVLDIKTIEMLNLRWPERRLHKSPAGTDAPSHQGRMAEEIAAFEKKKWSGRSEESLGLLADRIGAAERLPCLGIEVLETSALLRVPSGNSQRVSDLRRRVTVSGVATQKTVYARRIVPRANKRLNLRRKLEAPPGFEPGMEVLRIFVELSILLTGLVLWSRMMVGLP